MRDLEFMELILLRARDQKQWQLTNTPESERKLEDVVTYKVLSDITRQLTRFNVERKREIHE